MVENSHAFWWLTGRFFLFVAIDEFSSMKAMNFYLQLMNFYQWKRWIFICNWWIFINGSDEFLFAIDEFLSMEANWWHLVPSQVIMPSCFSGQMTRHLIDHCLSNRQGGADGKQKAKKTQQNKGNLIPALPCIWLGLPLV